MTTPWAQFRFNGTVVNMARAQFEQACRDGKICGCNACLACRALEYKREAYAKLKQEGRKLP